VALPSFANPATTTTSLALSGIVELACSFFIQGTNEASALLLLAGAVNDLIATATEYSNNQYGYAVRLHGSNGSKLLGSNQNLVNPDVLPYTVTDATTDR